jgi:hypothetical protein
MAGPWVAGDVRRILIGFAARNPSDDGDFTASQPGDQQRRAVHPFDEASLLHRARETGLTRLR